jgi:hypothetical protein
VGEFNRWWCGSLLKGGDGNAAEGGEGVGRRVGRSGGGERGGPGHGRKWLGLSTSAPGWQARSAALPRYSGGWRDARGVDASG